MKFIKNMRVGRFIAGLLLLSLLSLNISAQTGLSEAERSLTKSVSVKYIKKITTELSDDRFEGRGTLQRGGDLAASWIAAEMKSLGLKPGGGNGTFLQSVPFSETIMAEGTNLKIGGESVVYSKDWATSGRTKDLDLSGETVYIGHGIISASSNRDDLAGVDFKNKFVVLIEGRPSNIPGEQWMAQQAKGETLVKLVGGGARGIIYVANGNEPLERATMIDFLSRRSIGEPGGGNAILPLPLILVNAATAEKLFSGSGTNLKTALENAPREDFKPMNLKPTVSIALRSKSTDGNSSNVVGYIEGSDPVLRKEAVVFTAHYDAYGLLGGKIYNGAADNAIGCGEMLAAARAFSKMKIKPKRSLVFIATTAEEYGLLGSRYWAKNPTWDITKIAAVMNLDGIGTEIMGPVKQMVGYGSPYSTLGPMFEDVAKSYGISTMEDPIPEQGVFKRSDHYSFVERGVPALMLVGAPAGSKQSFIDRFTEFERTKYHMPSDDVYRDWYWDGAKTVADMMTLIGYRVAQHNEMPAFTSGNPFSNLKRGDFYTEIPGAAK